MKLAFALSLLTIPACLLALAAPAHALSCPSRATFDDKVKASPNVVIGELIKIDKKKYQVKVLKVLKDGGLLRKKKSFTVDLGVPRMGSGFSFKPKRGQLILFFLLDKVADWTCYGPILIR